MVERKYKWRRSDYQENTRGLLMVHTGNGKGKTTCALGLMMRAAGQGLNCCMIQFMKSRNDRWRNISAYSLTKWHAWATLHLGHQNPIRIDNCT
jgi:ATP:corrinoid adenosyltransferase